MREFFADVRYRLRAIFLRSRMEEDLDAELRFHLDREAEELRRRGLTPAEARRQAHIAFGGVELMKQETRDARGTALFESVLQDLRYAFRTLRKEPAFTLTVVLLLGLGIGANTATFRVMHALLFRSLGVSHPEQLVIIGDPSAVGSNWNGSPQIDFVSFPLYQDVRSRTAALLDIYAAGRLNAPDVRIAGRSTDASGSADHTAIRLVSGNYFDVLQVPAFRGRVFTSRDDTSANAPVAVISDGYWLRSFARDPAVIGSAITVNHVPLTIVAVMPPGFGDVVGSATDIWVPLMLQPLLSPQQKMLDDRDASWLQMMGRLAPGITLAQARAAISGIEADAVRAHLTGKDLAQFESDHRDDPVRVGPGALGFSRYRRNYGPALVVLMCAVGLIVLIVCANVANLMLVRAVARAREMTVRIALGAGRRRLVRQLLVETLLLAAAGGAIGLFASNAGSHLLVSLVNAPISLDTGTDGNVLLFGAGLTLICAILFGLVPAFKGTRVDVASALRAQGRSLVGTRARVGRFGAGRALVVVQITLSTVLLIGAGLLIRSMQQIMTADLGFDRDRLVLVHVPTLRAGYTPARAAALAAALPERLAELPGVLGAGTTLHGLFTGGYGTLDIVAESASRSALPLEVRYDAVGPGYFHAIGDRLLRGREFDTRDTASAAKVAVVNESLARFLFGDGNPIGAALRDDKGVLHSIVGVVGDLHETSMRDAPREAYIPISQKDQNGFWMAVHVDRDPAASIAAVRRAVLDVDASLPLEVRSFSDLAGESVAEDRLTMQVTTFFGIVALLLAALGLHGVTSYATSRRSGEFGLRMALGARPESVTRMVLGEAATLGVIGLACGLPAGLAATRLLRDQIFGVGRIDPPSLAAALTILIAATLLAAYLPARRAARVSPLEALRTE